MNPAHERGSMDPWSMFLTPIILVLSYNIELFQAESKQTLEGKTSFLSNRERSRYVTLSW